MRNNFFLLNKAEYNNFLKYNQLQSSFGFVSVKFYDIFFKDKDVILLKKLNQKYELYQLSQTTSSIVINYFDLLLTKFFLVRSYIFIFLVFSVTLVFLYLYVFSFITCITKLITLYVFNLVKFIALFIMQLVLQLMSSISSIAHVFAFIFAICIWLFFKINFPDCINFFDELDVITISDIVIVFYIFLTLCFFNTIFFIIFNSFCLFIFFIFNGIINKKIVHTGFDASADLMRSADFSNNNNSEAFFKNMELVKMIFEVVDDLESSSLIIVNHNYNLNASIAYSTYSNINAFNNYKLSDFILTNSLFSELKKSEIFNESNLNNFKFYFDDLDLNFNNDIIDYSNMDLRVSNNLSTKWEVSKFYIFSINETSVVYSKIRLNNSNFCKYI